MDQTNEKNLSGIKNNMPVAIYYYISTLILSFLISLGIMFIMTIVSATIVQYMAKNDNTINSLGIITALSILLSHIISMFFACKISTKRIFKQYRAFDKQTVIKLSSVLFISFYIIYILWSVFKNPKFDLIISGISFIISSILFYIFTKKNIQKNN